MSESGDGPVVHPDVSSDDDPSAPQEFRIAGWHVVPSTNRIHADGKAVKLEPRVMDLLVYLSRRQGQVVTREDMERAVWTGMVVGYDTPSAAVRKLRKALGDDPRRPRIIETFSKRGYRLVAPVKALSEARPAPKPVRNWISSRPTGTGSRWLLGGTILGLAAALIGLSHWELPRQASERDSGRSAAPVTVAVLPLENLNEHAARSYVGDGLSDDLSTSLSKVPGLRVIARESTFHYKNGPLDTRQVAEELGADFLIHGSVLRSGKRIRVNLHLVDSEDGAHLWAERYDGSWDRILLLQDEINRAIVSTLSRHIGAGTGEDGRP